MLGIRSGHERKEIKFQLIPGPSTTLTIIKIHIRQYLENDNILKTII